MRLTLKLYKQAIKCCKQPTTSVKVGIAICKLAWIPAFAGMTGVVGIAFSSNASARYSIAYEDYATSEKSTQPSSQSSIQIVMRNPTPEKKDFECDKELLLPIIKEKAWKLSAKLSTAKTRVSFQDFTLSQPLKTFAKPQSYILSSLETSESWDGEAQKFPVGQTYYHDKLCALEEKAKTCVPIILNIFTEHKILVANKNLDKNHLVIELDLDEGWTATHQAFVSDSSMIVGKKTKTVITSGDGFLPYQLEKPLTITRGVMVPLKLNNKDINISVKATPLQDGSTGDQIRVSLDSQNKKVINATVLPGGELEATQ